VEKSEEPTLDASVLEPATTLPSQPVRPEHSTEKSSEPNQLNIAVPEVMPVHIEQPATTGEAPAPDVTVTGKPITLQPEMWPEEIHIGVKAPAETGMVSSLPPDHTEQPADGVEPAAPAESSITPMLDLHEDAPMPDDQNIAGVRIYTDTTEGVPQVDRDVQETEEVLPDGTIVRRQVVTTSQRQTISTRVVMEGPEDVLPASKAEAEQLLGEMGVTEELGRQITTSDSKPEESTNVEEHEEVLPDGSVVKRRVVTTTKQHVTTEHVSLDDDDIPAGSSPLT